MTLRVVELFAGIGAQRMSLTLAGIPHEVVGISEIDRHALASYEAIYGDCPNLGDITKVEALPPCDLVTYSFPCQDLSLAGKRKGMAEDGGTRSGLVWEVVRLLETAGERERPEWLLMENVPQVLTAPEWPSLVGRLEAMGYRNEWAKLDSSRFGSAQKRVRAFMVSRLGASPPPLPTSSPGAPRLCLHDVMEASRDERFVRRIPLDRVRWREPPEGYRHPQSEGIDCPLMDAGASRLEARRISSEDGLCPTLRTGCPQTVVEEEEEERVEPLVERADSLRMAPKGRKAIGTLTESGVRLKVAPSDGPGSSTPCAEVEGVIYYPERVIYSSSSSSPTVCTDHGNNRIKVVADQDRPGYLEKWNRLYSSSSASPTLVKHDGGGKDVMVVADDTGETYDRMARLYSDGGKAPTVDQLGRRGNQMVKIVAEDASRAYGSSAKILSSSSSSSPTLRAQVHGLQNQPKVLDRIEEKGCIEKDGTWDMAVPHRDRFREQRIVGTDGKSPTLAVKHDAKVRTTEEEEGGCLLVNVLTPLECWRLMGFPYWAYKRASAVSSETQLYKQAGNSIVVEVLMAIFRTMYPRPLPRVQATIEEASA